LKEEQNQQRKYPHYKHRSESGDAYNVNITFLKKEAT
jgi:hypothetical protein